MKILYCVNYFYWHWVTVLLIIVRKYRWYILCWSITSFMVTFEGIKCYLRISWVNFNGNCKNLKQYIEIKVSQKKGKKAKEYFLTFIISKIFYCTNVFPKRKCISLFNISFWPLYCSIKIWMELDRFYTCIIIHMLILTNPKNSIGAPNETNWITIFC